MWYNTSARKRAIKKTSMRWKNMAVKLLELLDELRYKVETAAEAIETFEDDINEDTLQELLEEGGLLADDIIDLADDIKSELNDYLNAAENRYDDQLSEQTQEAEVA